MISISVIIPMHNSDKYIERCLNSLLSQDYSNFEIFIIDDASNDNSLEIVKNYAIQYNNIKIKELKENKGVSYARNCGIKECSNEYIMFSDSDDWYEVNALSTISKAAEENNADFVIANHYISYDRKKTKINYEGFFNSSKISKKECISYMTLSSCSKLIKKSIFLDNNITYPINIKRCEELPVIPIAAFYANNPIFISNYLYNYYQRKGSASNKKSVDVSFFDETFSLFKERFNYQDYMEELEFRAIEHLLYGKTLVMLKANVNKNEISEHINNFKHLYPNFINNKYLKNFSSIKRMFIKFLYLNNIFFSKIFAILHSKLTG